MMYWLMVVNCMMYWLMVVNCMVRVTVVNHGLVNSTMIRPGGDIVDKNYSKNTLHVVVVVELWLLWLL